MLDDSLYTVEYIISIHAPREGGDQTPPLSSGNSCISIHAPREGGDFKRWQPTQVYLSISIHAPREGGDLLLCYRNSVNQRFQSTPPARGATATNQQNAHSQQISIHAPREGGDWTASTQHRKQ